MQYDEDAINANQHTINITIPIGRVMTNIKAKNMNILPIKKLAIIMGRKVSFITTTIRHINFILLGSFNFLKATLAIIILPILKKTVKKSEA